MGHTLEDFIEKTMQASSTRDVGELLKQSLTAEGYENIVFVKTRNFLLHRIVWAELPDGYAAAYQASGWDRIDPVLKHATSTTEPFAWEKAVLRAKPTRELSEFFEECRLFGVHSGITIPLHHPSSQTDLVSLSVRQNERPSQSRVPIIYGMAVQAWLRHSQLEVNLKRPSKDLSKRELECLRWMRDGKTNSEIGDLLNVSDKTVQFHAGNIFKKLGVQTRVEAVITGIQAGLINL